MAADDLVLERMFRNVGEYFARCAEASPGGRALELGGVRAAVIPALPDASIVNCVTYADPDELASRIDELGGVYDDAGVRAWAVWTHESDEQARTTLAQAGFVLDSEPMSMALDLDGGGGPPAPPRGRRGRDPPAGPVAGGVPPALALPPPGVAA